MRNFRKSLALLLAVLMLVGLIPTASAAEAEVVPDLRESATGAAVDATGIDPEEWVTVIVELQGETTLDVEEFTKDIHTSMMSYTDNDAVVAMRNEMVEEQTAVERNILTQVNADAAFCYHYTNVLNGFAAKVQYKDIEAIKDLDDVLDVYLTQTYTYDTSWDEVDGELNFVSLDEYLNLENTDGVYTETTEFADSGSVDLMNLKEAYDKGYTGKNKVVAVFDSSLYYQNKLFQYMDPELTKADEGNYHTKDDMMKLITDNKESLNLFEEGWGSWFHGQLYPDVYSHQGFDAKTQEAILKGEFWHNEKVPFAVDYMDGDLEVWDGDTGSHGTHTSGIAAGNAGPVDPSKPASWENTNGVLGGAYDAQLFFFKIFSENDETGQESDEAIFAAMDDAVTLGANAFNFSLGLSNGNTYALVYAQAGYMKAYNRAAAAGISIAVSAGNDARGSNSYSLKANYSTVLPNWSTLGYSGSTFAPMTVASAQGTGYSYNTYLYTVNAAFTDDSPELGIAVDATAFYAAEPLAGQSFEIIDVGNGTEEDILKATKAEKLDKTLLEGKVALVQATEPVTITTGWRGTTVTDPHARTIATTLAKAGASGMIIGNDEKSEDLYAVPGNYIPENFFTFGRITVAQYTALKAAVAKGDVSVSFTSLKTLSDTVSKGSYADNGPSGFTGWGVTDSLRLKPDIMAPGGSILSAGATNPDSYATMSGTSMAAPNMEGAFIPVQQYVEDMIKQGVFDVKTGTQEYTNLINQLVASTARAYQPISGNTSVYFSPRRQGSGMANIGAAINSKVVLHNNVENNKETGEAPRTKVELLDGLKDTFEFTFTLDNYNDAARYFDVTVALQTDATTTQQDGQVSLVAPSSNGSDVDPIEDATITIKSVENATLTKNANTNINLYNTSHNSAQIEVPAKTKGVKITIEVKLNENTMKNYDTLFPNGMFLEGYVFLDSAVEDVHIPFMGFRGDWTDAPIFDTKTAYDDYSDLDVTDPEYPFWAISTLNSLNKENKEIVLGANQYSGTWPAYPGSSPLNNVRNYLNAQKEAGYLSVAHTAFSPNADGYSDIVYADMQLLRNAFAVYVEVTDEDGKVVKTMGPEFAYYETQPFPRGNSAAGLADDMVGVAKTYGTLFLHDMGWDGTDDAGKAVAEGQYTYTVYGITEYEFLKNNHLPAAESNTVDQVNHVMTGVTPEYKALILKDLQASETKDSMAMQVKVDLTAPTIEIVYNEATKTVTATAKDAGSGVQSVAIYVGTVEHKQLIADDENAVATYTLQDGETVEQVSAQAVDYAMNVKSETKVTTVNEPTTPGGTTPGGTTPGGTTPGGTTPGGTTPGGTVPGGTTTPGTTTPGTTEPGTTEPGTTEPGTTPTTGYTDVPANERFADAVAYVTEKGLMTGMPDGTFAPYSTTTRGQIVTILYRLAGEPAVEGSSYSDVAGDAYYAAAAAWGAANGIVTGYDDGTYRPNNDITREQLAAILYRFAEYKGVDVTATYDLSGFTDRDNVSGYASAAMQWAVAAGLINGTDATTLAPQGNANRAQVATILQRLCEDILA